MSDEPREWTDPVFGDRFPGLAPDLKSRLDDLSRDVTAGRLPRQIYYEQMHCLVTLALVSQEASPTAFDLEEKPSQHERRFGQLLGQSMHQGLSLDDLALASNTQPEQLIAIGKRTIQGWAGSSESEQRYCSARPAAATAVTRTR